jgi:hypothetical protein
MGPINIFLTWGMPKMLRDDIINKPTQWLKSATLTSILILTLSACDQGPPPIELKSTSLKEVTKIVSKRIKFRDGRWESKGKILGYSMGTLPDDDKWTRDLIQVMQRKMSDQPEVTLSMCRDSKNPNLFVLPGVEAEACTVDYFRMEGNKAEIKSSATSLQLASQRRWQ